jgi:hypothetical protein
MNNLQIRQIKTGMILPFTLAILALISLMGFYILGRTRIELSITGNIRNSQQAFASADSFAPLAVLMSRLLLHPEIGTPEQIISKPESSNAKIPFSLSINETRYNIAQIKKDSTSFDVQKRYLETGFMGQSENPPHLTFQVGRNQVAAAVISMDNSNLVMDGMSINGGDNYDKNNGSSLAVNLVVSVNGQTLSSKNLLTDINSFVTAIYREYL